MKSSITFTSTLSSELMRWITQYTKERSMTKRAVIEEALIRYRHETKRKRMEDSFKQAARDPEMQEMAEWGIKDFNDMIKRYEA